jgi:hypothetical protein
MNFTFGIVTSSDHKHDINLDNNQRLDIIVDSIEKLNIPNYEVIVVGKSNINRVHTTVIDFDENIKPGWITKKKNIITKNAKYDNIVYLHDYVYFEPNWYSGFIKFGENWDICMTVIKNTDNTRFRDWIIFELDETNYPRVLEFGQDLGEPNRKIAPYLPLYNKGDSTKTYISGMYWIAKKSIMEKYPLNEKYVWNTPEDIEWSQRVRRNCKYVMNPYSSIKMMKYKNSNWYSHHPYYMTEEYINKELI